MAATRHLQQIREAVANLNPRDVREAAERPISIGLHCAASSGYAAIEDYLSPPGISRKKRWEQVGMLHRAGEPGAPERFDIEIYEDGLAWGPNSFVFSPHQPEQLVREILERREDLGLPLARLFPPFRRPVVKRIVHSIAWENAMFALVTALPDVAPGLGQVPWSIGQFASDTAFITINQIRMGFLLAAASDRPIGYREQRKEVASIIAGAFGWRALARSLVGKIPFGAGLIPKAAVAYAGTCVVGASLERFYRVGYGYTRAERRLAYREALARGKALAGSWLRGGKPGAAAPRPVVKATGEETSGGGGL